MNMKFTSFISYVLHPFLSLLCLSVLFMAAAMQLDDSAESLLSFSSEDAKLIFLFGTLFILYPLLVFAFALPSLVMDYFQVNYWIRTFIFFILGVVCMFLNTILSDYSFLYVGIAITFSIIDFFFIKYRSKK